MNLTKTGLGSSACLIIGLIGSLLFTTKNDISNSNILFHSLKLLYMFSNKLGSGYDIYTSIYGSNLFWRKNL